jgi:hypothetical protein
MPTGQFGVDDIRNVAVYVDTLGCHAWDDKDFSNAHYTGARWRKITNFDLMEDTNGNLVALDMRSSYDAGDVLAVVYAVIDAAGDVTQRVGDDPDLVDPTQVVNGVEGVLLPDEGAEDDLRHACGACVRLRAAQHLFPGRHEHRPDHVPAAHRDDGHRERADAGPEGEGRHHRTARAGVYPDLRAGPAERAGRAGSRRQGRPQHRAVRPDEGPPEVPAGFPAAVRRGQGEVRAVRRSSDFVWAQSRLADNPQDSLLYEVDTQATQFPDYAHFEIIATHAAAASSFNLGASNIEEGSETVTLDGRTLTRDVDYEIDYTFGEIQLKGEAANLSADSKIGVDYQYAPFLGGGNTSLMGLSLGYDLGRDSKVATTWLYQSESIVGEKAKLGEEPSKNLVGNFNVQHTFKPAFLTKVANFLSRNDSERESTVQFSGELAISKPNPNTKGLVYLEDFEGVDASDMVSLNRLSWSYASVPQLGAEWLRDNPDTRTFAPTERVQTIRWFLPKDRVLRRYLNPDLVNQERDETQTAMDLYLRADGTWQQGNWGGIMRGISRTGLDLSKSQFVEVWINDKVAEPTARSGRLHIDFGYINEDGYWPTEGGGLVVGQFEKEDGILAPDGIGDGVWQSTEDIGLSGSEAEALLYSADYDYKGDSPYPRINNTSRNNREDTEDLNANGNLDRTDGYFTVTIDLKDTEPLVDVVQDYDNVADLIAGNIAWRKYRIPLAAIDQVEGNAPPDIKAVTHARIWYENDSPTAPAAMHLQISELRFLGSRWEREGVRRIDGEILLSPGERLPDEEFFLGEVNNKENPDYSPPFAVHVENNIPDKEQSLVLNYQDLERGHMMRVSKQVSPRGDDYTAYRNMSWYWYNPSHDTADLDLLFRVGADTLNYYEVAYRFSDSGSKTGWRRMSVGLAELSNAKNGELREDGAVHSRLADLETGEEYRVRVVGRPDLRRVRRYYMAVANNLLTTPATGYLYINDVRLEGIKRENGMAQRAGLRLNMADVFKVDFDWKHNDDTFHGLDKRVGTGIDHEEWSVANSLNLEDYVPLAGFRLPVSGSRRQTIDQPRYVTNSDIEILDNDLLGAMTTISTREQVSARLNHTPAKAVLLRYLVDPWSLQMSGSRESNEGPLLRSRSKSLQGSLNFDLRIPGAYSLASYPVVGRVPILKNISLVPRKVALGASFACQRGRLDDHHRHGRGNRAPGRSQAHREADRLLRLRAAAGHGHGLQRQLRPRPASRADSVRGQHRRGEPAQLRPPHHLLDAEGRQDSARAPVRAGATVHEDAGQGEPFAAVQRRLQRRARSGPAAARRSGRHPEHQQLGELGPAPERADRRCGEGVVPGAEVQRRPARPDGESAAPAGRPELAAAPGRVPRRGPRRRRARRTARRHDAGR